jgi:poly-gamma-glutamate capsule biosynthesis protein CapA/YwtB (metallophosphatase superfamily)
MPFLPQQKKHFISTNIITSVILIAFLLGCANKNESLQLVFAGDLMLDRGVRETIEKNNPDYLFKDIRPIFKNSEIVVANLECVACDSTIEAINKKFTFRANPEWLSAVNTSGITHLTLANNHSFDYGYTGLKQTLTNLETYKLNSIGATLDSNACCLPTIIKKNGTEIVIFSSSFLKQNNSFVCNENASNLSNTIKTFKKQNPSCVVFVCLHWGVEMEITPTKEQVSQAHFLIEAGADAIIGHHPHVVQSIELYNGKYIFYSLGNFVFDNNHSPENRGIFAKFSFLKGKIQPIHIIPYTIVKSKPKQMTQEESNSFMHDIDSISQTLDLKPNNGSWKVL